MNLNSVTHKKKPQMYVTVKILKIYKNKPVYFFTVNKFLILCRI